MVAQKGELLRSDLTLESFALQICSLIILHESFKLTRANEAIIPRIVCVLESQPSSLDIAGTGRSVFPHFINYGTHSFSPDAGCGHASFLITART